MNGLSARLFSISPQSFWNWGRIVLTGWLGLILLIIVYATWSGSELLFLLPIVTAGGIGAWYLFHYPLLNLCAVLAGFAFVADHSEGLDLIEVLYGLYVFGFLAHWFVSRTLLCREPYLDSTDAKALFFFLLGATATVALSLAYGARPSTLMGEWAALFLLAIYFPVREACIRYRIGPLAILSMLAWIGLYAGIRNGLDYWYGLQNAEHLFQILKNRSDTNGNVVMAISLFYLVFVVFARRWKVRGVLLVGFVISATTLVLSQSRALWVSFLFGGLLMLFVVDRRERIRIMTLGVVAGAGIVTVGLLFFGDVLMLILVGLIERAATLSAGAGDFSLRLRAIEAKAVLEHILQNPVIGHGMAVPFSFFDPESQRTIVRSFIHNGYVSLWYRFGLWGLALVMVFWIRSIWHGFTVFRDVRAPMMLRLVGLGAGISLATYLLSSNASNVLFLKDTTLFFGILAGLTAGVHERALLLTVRS